MTPEDFTALQRLLQQRSGYALSSDKLYLVAGRLGPVALKFGFRGVLELMSVLRRSPSDDLIAAVVDAMATHETLFFRDKTPFDQFEQVILPELLRRRASAKRLKVWSAACSTGQEAYSIAMLVQEAMLPRAGWSVDILGTDLVQSALDKATSATYTPFEVARGLAQDRLQRHFDREGANWVIKPEVRRMVSFRIHNLISDIQPYGPFDLIMCRNVLIYFDHATKIRVLSAVASRASEDGYVILGAADTFIANECGLTAVAGSPGMFTVNSTRKLNKMAG